MRRWWRQRRRQVVNQHRNLFISFPVFPTASLFDDRPRVFLSTLCCMWLSSSDKDQDIFRIAFRARHGCHWKITQNKQERMRRLPQRSMELVVRGISQTICYISFPRLTSLFIRGMNIGFFLSYLGRPRWLGWQRARLPIPRTRVESPPRTSANWCQGTNCWNAPFSARDVKRRMG